MKIVNKPYPLNDVTEIENLKELVDYCGVEFANKYAFRWLEKKVEKNKHMKIRAKSLKR